MSYVTKARDAYASKNEDDLKNEHDLKNKDDLKKITCPPPLERILPEIFFDDLSPQQPQDNWY